MTISLLNKYNRILHYALIYLAISCLIKAYEHNQQIIIEGPIDQQAKIGEQIVLKCKIKNLKGEPQWCIDDFCFKKGSNKFNKSFNIKRTTKT
jgi:hypothetical protein